MGRSRYKIYEPTHPHFVTCTILHWLPLFTRQESVDIILQCFRYLQQNDNLKLYAYVILENHIHMVVRSNDISKSMESFKKYTANELLKLLQKENIKTILNQLRFYKKAYRVDKVYQIWEEGYHPKLMQTDAMMINKINYIHQNPVKRGYVDEATHWRYSSARDYEGMRGLIDIERFW
ncbi:MAG: transposase [Sulfurovaceae bacterium]|nr:transposase [Sulfurovaceae bacterium]MDD5549225.1 transposase [Sulfurovaceae bacterium]